MTSSKRINLKLVFLIALLAMFAALSWYIGSGRMLPWLQDMRGALNRGLETWPVLFRLGYTVLSALIIGAFIPAGAPLLMLGGALFSFWEAMLWCAIGHTAGCIMGFLISRAVFRDAVQGRLGDRIRLVNESFEKYGVSYLVILRVAPVLPSEMVNLFAGLTPLTLLTFSVVTLFARLPINAIYINLGSDIWQINTLHDLLSPSFIISMSVLCAFLLGGHITLRWLARRNPGLAGIVEMTEDPSFEDNGEDD